MMHINTQSDHFELSQVEEGSTVRVASLAGSQGIKRRLASFGVRTGTTLRLVQRLGSRRAVLEIGFGRVALGAELMQAIRVLPEDEA